MKTLAEKIADMLTDSEGPLADCPAPFSSCATRLEANIDSLTDSIQREIDRHDQRTTTAIPSPRLEGVRGALEALLGDFDLVEMVAETFLCRWCGSKSIHQKHHPVYCGQTNCPGRKAREALALLAKEPANG